MAHKTIELDIPVKQKRRYTLPQFEGKFGMSLFVGGKEIFIGIQIAEVSIEKIVRQRLVKTQKGKVNVFKFD